MTAPQQQSNTEAAETSPVPIPPSFPGGLPEARQRLARVLEIQASVRSARQKNPARPAGGRYLHTLV